MTAELTRLQSESNLYYVVPAESRPKLWGQIANRMICFGYSTFHVNPIDARIVFVLFLARKDPAKRKEKRFRVERNVCEGVTKFEQTGISKLRRLA